LHEGNALMFVWDEEKRRSNLIKHGIDFNVVWQCDWWRAYHTPDERIEYGELRVIAFVPFKGRLLTCVYTPRGNDMRVISLRKAKPKEDKRYAEAMDNI
jgi:uncharacterized protein